MIGFVGLTHLGIVSSAAAARQGFDTVAVDPDRNVCDSHLRAALFEPGLAELFDSVRPRLSFASDLSVLVDCSLVFLSLDISTDSAGIPDLAEFDRLMGHVLEVISPTSTLIVLSQVPPGTTRKWADGFQRQRSASSPPLYYQMETLIFGRAVERACCPERFIVGCTDPSSSLPAPYFDFLHSFGCPVLQMGYESAELCKLAVNCFLISSISTTNVLAEVAGRLGASWSEMATALRLDRRIGPDAYLSPGLGLGGSNLMRDLTTMQTLSGRLGTESSLLNAWLKGSAHCRDWALRHLHTAVLGRVAQPTLGLWGLTYKADTACTTNSPALALIDAVAPTPVRAFDPHAQFSSPAPPHLTRTDSPLAACRGTDALLVMTPWKEFFSFPLQRIRRQMRGRTILDPLGVIDHDEATFLGFHHYELGAAPPAIMEGV